MVPSLHMAAAKTIRTPSVFHNERQMGRPVRGAFPEVSRLALSKQVDLTPGQIGKIFSGDSDTTLSMSTKIAAALRISVEELQTEIATYKFKVKV